LHTNGYDEALSLPTEQAASLALRTQQILAEETGVAETADPLAGSYFVEALTAELRTKAAEWIERIDKCGGAVKAIESGVMQNAIAENAYQHELARESGQEIVVGVNRFTEKDSVSVPIQKIDQAATRQQIARVTAYKAAQNRPAVESALATVEAAARGTDNLLYAFKDAILAGAALGQICDVLRGVFGVHRAN